MAARGRPSKYTEVCTRDEEAYRLCLLGMKDEELCEYFQIKKSTLNLWKKKHVNFMDAIKAGRRYADGKAALSIYKAVCGYTETTTKDVVLDGKVVTLEEQKYYPPNPTLAIFWMTNRQHDNWKRQRHDEEDAGKLAESLLEVIKSLGSNLPG